MVPQFLRNISVVIEAIGQNILQMPMEYSNGIIKDAISWRKSYMNDQFEHFAVRNSASEFETRVNLSIYCTRLAYISTQMSANMLKLNKET